jgi:hypothetical protein
MVQIADERKENEDHHLMGLGREGDLIFGGFFFRILHKEPPPGDS